MNQHRIPTARELFLEAYPSDKHLLDNLLSSKGNFPEIIFELFTEYQILRDDLQLYLDLLELLGEALRNIKDRSELSIKDREIRKRIPEAYLERAQYIIQDPDFVWYMGFDRIAIQEKMQPLEDIIKGIRGGSGHRKLLKGKLPAVLSGLSKYGIGTNQQVDFIRRFLVGCSVPEFGTNKSDDREKIYKWVEEVGIENKQ